MYTDNIDLKKYMEFYLKTEGKEIVFEILNEYFQNNKIAINSSKSIEDKAEETNSLKNTAEKENEIIVKIADNFPEIFINIKEQEENMGADKVISKFKKFIFSLKEENKDLKTLNEKINESYTEKLREIKTLEENKKELENKKINLEKEKKDLEESKIKLSKEIESLKKEKDDLKILNSHLTTEKKSIEETVNFLKGEKEKLGFQTFELNKKIEKIADERKDEKEKLRELYKLQELYDNYLKMPEEIKIKLKGLIRYENINSFIACCFSIATMDDLWDFVNEEAKKDNEFDLSILKDIFSYFVEQQNKKYSENVYRVLIPECGESFEPREHTSINSIRDGKILDVIFPGYGILNEKTDDMQKEEDRKYKKIKKPAIVKSN